MKEETKFVIRSFVIWRLALFLFLFLALAYVPLQKNFLGGGIDNYLKNPYLWAWVNFDGEHYLSIAQIGYQPLTYFYFPLYPLLVKFFTSLVDKSFIYIAVSGLVLSNTAFLIGLIGLIRLIRLDYSKDLARISVILLLLFPTSFYFGSFYTESLFFTLSIWAFYFGRKKKWLLASILGSFATATRFTGIILFPALLVEYFYNDKEKSFKKLLLSRNFPFLMIVPFGIFIYMYYLNLKTGDPLEFFHSVGIFGEQRSSSLIFLPQVFYRYFFKIIPALNFGYYPVLFSTLLEFTVGILFLFLSLLSFYRIRLSYAVYLTLGYLLPTLSGSFSSLQRYVLVLFPGFLLSALYLSKVSKFKKMIIYLLLSIGLFISTSLFTRGYWIS